MIAFPEHLALHVEPVVAIQIEDERLEELKNVLISQMIADPDLDAEAIGHHLERLEYTNILDDLFSADMIARFGMPLDRMSSDKAGDMLAELLDVLAKHVPDVNSGDLIKLQQASVVTAMNTARG